MLQTFNNEIVASAMRAILFRQFGTVILFSKARSLINFYFESEKHFEFVLKKNLLL